MKKILLLIIAISINAHAYCYYVSCAPSVMAATVMASGNLEKSYLKIFYKLNELKGEYQNYVEVLKINNTGYEENRKLKAQYLFLLQQISAKQNEIIEVKSR